MRMVVSGSIVARCDTDEILSIIAARLRSQSPGLAVGSVNLDHLHLFRTLGAARGTAGVVIAGRRHTHRLARAIPDRKAVAPGHRSRLATRGLRSPSRRATGSASLAAAQRHIACWPSNCRPVIRRRPSQECGHPTRPTSNLVPTLTLPISVRHAPRILVVSLGKSAREESFVGQQNSLWLFQNDIAKMIYTGTRRLASSSGSRPAEPMSVTPAVQQARSTLPRTQSGPTWRWLVRHQIHTLTGHTTN